LQLRATLGFAGSGTFRFFRPDPNSGMTQQFLTVTLADVRVKSHRILLPNTQVAATAAQPVLEEVTLSYSSITIHYELTGAEAILAVGAP
jgi:type VI protein secretion system component Hcp